MTKTCLDCKNLSNAPEAKRKHDGNGKYICLKRNIFRIRESPTCGDFREKEPVEVCLYAGK